MNFKVYRRKFKLKRFVEKLEKLLQQTDTAELLLSTFIATIRIIYSAVQVGGGQISPQFFLSLTIFAFLGSAVLKIIFLSS